jgi:hypothetical protein
MKKYDPLGNYLARQFSSGLRDRVCLTLKEIEQILGFVLPPSAHTHCAWWSNSLSHPQACSWLDIGWKVSNVDIEGKAVTFAHTLIFTINEVVGGEGEELTLKIAVNNKGLILLVHGLHASATSNVYRWRQLVQVLLDMNPHMFGHLTGQSMHRVFPEMLAKLGYSVVNWETNESWGKAHVTTLRTLASIPSYQQ